MNNSQLTPKLHTNLEHKVEFPSQSEQIMLLELSFQLQAAVSLNDLDEMHRKINQAMPKIFKNTPGSIYLLENEQLDKWQHIASWGGFSVEDRYPDIDVNNGSNSGESENLHAVFSVPLEIQNENFGVLRLSLNNMRKEGIHEDQPNAVLKHISFAMSNLYLLNKRTYEAYHDLLSGLVNRRRMLNALSNELKRCERYKHQLSVIMFDVDNFKHFNDKYGHEAGDAVIIAIGNLLPQIVREVDIACRWGGEEFMLLLVETPLNKAMILAEHIRESVAALKVSCEGVVLPQVTCSLGVSSSYPDHGMKEDELLRTVDLALYEAKSSGRNKVVMAKK